MHHGTKGPKKKNREKKGGKRRKALLDACSGGRNREGRDDRSRRSCVGEKKIQCRGFTFAETVKILYQCMSLAFSESPRPKNKIISKTEVQILYAYYFRRDSRIRKNAKLRGWMRAGTPLNCLTSWPRASLRNSKKKNCRGKTSHGKIVRVYVKKKKKGGSWIK